MQARRPRTIEVVIDVILDANTTTSVGIHETKRVGVATRSVIAHSLTHERSFLRAAHRVEGEIYIFYIEAIRVREA